MSTACQYHGNSCSGTRWRVMHFCGILCSLMRCGKSHNPQEICRHQLETLHFFLSTEIEVAMMLSRFFRYLGPQLWNSNHLMTAQSVQTVTVNCFKTANHTQEQMCRSPHWWNNNNNNNDDNTTTMMIMTTTKIILKHDSVTYTEQYPLNVMLLEVPLPSHMQPRPIRHVNFHICGHCKWRSQRLHIQIGQWYVKGYSKVV
jgi:hypothetical protein